MSNTLGTMIEKPRGRRVGQILPPYGRGLKVIKKSVFFSQKMDNISGTKTDRTNP